VIRPLERSLKDHDVSRHPGRLVGRDATSSHQVTRTGEGTRSYVRGLAVRPAVLSRLHGQAPDAASGNRLLVHSVMRDEPDVRLLAEALLDLAVKLAAEARQDQTDDPRAA